MSDKTMSCVDCAVRNCEFLDRMYPDFCPTAALTDEQVEEVLQCYGQEENKRAAIAAAEVETEAITAWIAGWKR